MISIILYTSFCSKVCWREEKSHHLFHIDRINSLCVCTYIYFFFFKRILHDNTSLFAFFTRLFLTPFFPGHYVAISANYFYIFLLPLHVFLSRGRECTQKCRLLFPRPRVQTFVMMVQVRHRHDRRVPRLKVALACWEKEKERKCGCRNSGNTRPHAAIFQQILTIRLVSSNYPRIVR